MWRNNYSQILFQNLKIEHNISASIFWSYIQFAFIECQVECYQIILKLSHKSLDFTSYKAFLKKQKKGLDLVSLLHYLHDFWRNISLLLCSISGPNLIFWLPMLREIYWAIGVLQLFIFVNQVVTPKFWNWTDLFNQAVSSRWPEVKTKISISWEWKELLRENKKHFSSFFQGFHWSKQNNFFVRF